MRPHPELAGKLAQELLAGGDGVVLRKLIGEVRQAEAESSVVASAIVLEALEAIASSPADTEPLAPSLQDLFDFYLAGSHFKETVPAKCREVFKILKGNLINGQVEALDEVIKLQKLLDGEVRTDGSSILLSRELEQFVEQVKLGMRLERQVVNKYLEDKNRADAAAVKV